MQFQYVFKFGKLLGAVAIPEHCNLLNYFDERYFTRQQGYNLYYKPVLPMHTLTAWKAENKRCGRIVNI